MADRKITQLATLLGSNAVAADELVIVDVTDATMSASGTNKKITLSQFQAAPLSAGTVNGVPYLNDSKILTTGSALTFDGTNLGIGTSSPLSTLDVRPSGNTPISGPTTGTWAARIVNRQDSSGFSGLSVQNRWTNTDAFIFEAAQGWNGTASGYYPVFTIDGVGQAIFRPQGTEAMRITAAGNVGIGTSSPDAGLTVIRSATISSQPNVAARIGAGVTSDLLLGSLNGDAPFVASQGAYPLIFYTNAVERARIDSSGNLIQSAPTTPPSLATNGQMVFNLTSNTNLRVSVRGSDGVTRTANITLA
jgi:hypothetical protein